MSMLSHAIRRARRSIAARLSLMLLAVFVLVLAGVAVHLNATLSRELDAQADAELYGRIELVRRALHEVPSAREIAAHHQHFEDVLRGHHRFLLAILDPQGAVLYQSAAFDAPDPMLLARIREQILSGREGDLERRGEDEFHARTAEGWVGGGPEAAVWIAAAVDMRDHRDLLAAHSEAMFISLVLGGVVAALGGWWMIRRGLAPVRRLAAAEEHISAGHLDARIEIEATPLELERVVQGFNSMLDRLGDSFRRLSDFSSDLAHELRTPINSLIGHAQVALSRPRTAAEYSKAIESIAEDGERVARIVREMLFLAQADNASAILRKERVDLRAEFEHVADYFDVLANERGVALACDGRAEVRADRTMVQRAISNLLSNALWHTPRGETVFVNIRSSDSGTVSLEVSNPGPGIPAEHLPRIFDRFHQVHEVRGDDTGRIGLGLAIVKSIMDLHKGSVEAESTPDGLTTIRLKFGA